MMTPAAAPAAALCPLRAACDVHVHVFSLGRLARGGEDGALSLLGAEELDALARIKAPQRRREFLFGRAAVRHLLARHAGVGAREVRIERTADAKPWARLENGPGLPSFNVSHSGDVLAVALSLSGDIGVDVELAEHAPIDLEAIARSQFSPSEYEALVRGVREPRLDAFFRMWTLKEAILKAVGIGLFHPLNRIDVAEPAARYAVAVERAGSAIGVTAQHRRLGHAGFHLAVARQGSLGAVHLFDEDGQLGEGAGENPCAARTPVLAGREQCRAWYR